MKDHYYFRKIRKDEVSMMFQMIKSRMKWMDEKGIRQWNVTNYDQVFPLDYYEEARQKDEVFVLEDKENGEIVCAAILLEHDERWNDDTPSLYIHNFVSQTDKKGVGKIYIEYVIDYARQKDKLYLRLDSMAGNTSLEKYYESLGFIPVGYCQEGEYHGILREKKL